MSTQYTAFVHRETARRLRISIDDIISANVFWEPKNKGLGVVLAAKKDEAYHKAYSRYSQDPAYVEIKVWMGN